MKKWLPLLVALLVGYVLAGRGNGPMGEEAAPIPEKPVVAAAPMERGAVERADDRLREAFERRQSNIQVRGAGEVSRLLADDDNGSRHQRIIVRLTSGQTVLIAHNIDLAPRVDGVRPGDQVAFYGEYEWNPQGGVIHWTHRDPAGQHVAGWLEVGGRRYQ